jgi:hypothetical protein
MPPSMPSTGVLPIIPTTLSCNGVSFSGGGPPPVFRDYLRTKAACFFGIAGTSASFFPKFIDASLMVCICSIHFPSYIFPNFNFWTKRCYIGKFWKENGLVSFYFIQKNLELCVRKIRISFSTRVLKYIMYQCFYLLYIIYHRLHEFCLCTLIYIV